MSGNKVFYGSDKSFWLHLYRSFIAVHGYTLAIVEIVLALIVFYILPATVVPLRHVLVVSAVAFTLIAVLAHAAWAGFYRELQVLPRVRRVLVPPDASATALLLLDASALFSYGSIVTIFYLEEGYEQMIGMGEVINIQDDKKIQVLVKHTMENTELWNHLLSNDDQKLRRLRVKATVSSLAMQALQQ